MDGTLLTILLLLVFATVLALIQARKRDKCLKDFESYPITLAQKSGEVAWGTVDVLTTGMEVRYGEPVPSPEGHLERSFIFYKDQYEGMAALYRHPEGLSEAEQERRATVIAQTVHPGVLRRLRRRLQNWIGILRDALVQAAGLVIGAAKARPGATVLSSQEQHLKALSTEVVGYAGNAFDPLLERHLFGQVVLEVTRNSRTRSYCGWLKDYTSQFIEILDAYANATDTRLPLAPYAPGDGRLDRVQVRVEGGALRVKNESDWMLHVQKVEAGAWSRPMGCVLPPDSTADLVLPSGVDPGRLQVWIGTVERVDMIVPRAHALVRHAAHGPGTLPDAYRLASSQPALPPAPAQLPAPRP